MIALALALTLAQVPYRLGDLETFQGPDRASAPSDFTPAGPVAFFWAADPFDGTELWVTDGTDAGTHLVLDLTPGTEGTSSAPMQVLDAGVVLLRANEGLFVTDGTAAGTRRLCCTGLRVDALALLPDAGVLLDDGTHLYRYDPAAPSGAVMVSNAAIDEALGQVGDRLLYLDDGTTGLYATDGVTSTRLTTVDNYGGLVQLARAGGSVYLFGYANTSTSLPTVYRTDGTVAGTTALGQFSAGVSGPLVASNDRLFFGSSDLYEARTAPFGFSMVADSSAVAELSPFRSGVLFAANAGAGVEPYFYDVLAGGAPVLLGDLVPGTGWSSPVSFTPNGNRAVFTTTGSSTPAQLYVTDGTAVGTQVLLAGAGKTAGEIVPFKSGWLASASVNGLWSPVVTDGTPANTRQVRRMWEHGNSGSTPRSFISYGSNVLFTANATGTGREVWKLPVLDGGLQLLADLAPADDYGASAPLVVMDGGVYFSGSDGNSGFELFVSRGEHDDPQLVRDVEPGFSSSEPQQLTAAGRYLYFTATTTVAGEELWRSDGTETGTVLVGDLYPGPESSYPSPLVPLPDGGVLFPAVFNIDGEVGLYRAGATGAQKLMDVWGLLEITAVGDVAFMSMADNQGDYELWVTDGSAAGTRRFADLRPGTANSSYPGSLTAQGERLFFFAKDSSTTLSLYVAEASAGVTKLVTFSPDMPGNPQGRYGWISPGPTGVYFPGWDAQSGLELWFSDGTAAGTHRVKDLWPGPASGLAYDEPLVQGGRRMFFTASDGLHGRELWASDGTEGGTRLVADLVPGPASSSPTELKAELGWLFFGASDPSSDGEPWALPLASGPPAVSAQVQGTAGADGGWYASDVTVKFTVIEPDAPLLAESGCGNGRQGVDGGFVGTVIVTDDGDRTVTCAVRTSGGASSASVFLRRDATAPRLTCPDDVSVGAVGPDGALVNFPAAVAVDAVDPMPRVTVDHTSGSAFPVGRTLVTASAVDHVGNTNTCRFVVTVVDSEPPVLTCPMDASVTVADPNGAELSFTATATDAIDPHPMLTYSSAPGSRFPVGKSGVSVLAIDASGNAASCSFTVAVKYVDESTGWKDGVTSACGCTSAPLGSLALALLLLMQRRRR
ncbi:MAG: HYR domain-containing protein [Archangiaceae bacterium]|nr:HYR domain-containing protein [Archangiaceae bacterium]